MSWLFIEAARDHGAAWAQIAAAMGARNRQTAQKRYADPISKAPGGRAGALPGKAGSVLFMKKPERTMPLIRFKPHDK